MDQTTYKAKKIGERAQIPITQFFPLHANEKEIEHDQKISPEIYIEMQLIFDDYRFVSFLRRKKSFVVSCWSARRVRQNKN